MSVPTPQTYTYKTFVNTDGEQTAIPSMSTFRTRTSEALISPWSGSTRVAFSRDTQVRPPHLLRALAKHSLALIAPDFRLCPQVSISEVLEDVTDAIRWTLSRAARAASGFTSDRVSTDEYILGGSSAGGWPALLLGLGLHDLTIRVPEHPTAVFAIYAITTVTTSLAPFFYEPQKPLSWAVDGKLIDRQPLEAEGHLQKCLDAEHQLLKNSSVKIRTEAPPANNPVRAALYNFSRQEGIYPSLILQDEKESEKVCTPSLIKSKLKGIKTKTPVLIAYGDADPKVPHSQSLHVVEALREVGYDDDKLKVIEGRALIISSTWSQRKKSRVCGIGCHSSFTSDFVPGHSYACNPHCVHSHLDEHSYLSASTYADRDVRGQSRHRVRASTDRGDPTFVNGDLCLTPTSSFSGTVPLPPRPPSPPFNARRRKHAATSSAVCGEVTACQRHPCS